MSEMPYSIQIIAFTMETNRTKNLMILTAFVKSVTLTSSIERIV